MNLKRADFTTAKRLAADGLFAETDLPAQVVPQAAVALTAGIDNQKYGFWFAVRAWARFWASSQHKALSITSAFA